MEMPAIGGGLVVRKQRDERQRQCCSPRGCVVGEFIDPDEPDDSVKVLCSNSECTCSWMHKVCFDAFEQQVLSVLRQSSRNRGWTDKQRAQGLWTKRGHDICHRACACSCGRGYLKKDMIYVPPKTDEDAGQTRRQQRRQRRHQNSKQLPAIGQGRTSSHGDWLSGQTTSPDHSPYTLAPRSRTLSVGSVAGIDNKLEIMGMDGDWMGDQRQRNQHGGGRKGSSLSGEDTNGFFDDTQVKSTGSIFRHRTDMSAFSDKLPRWKVNGFHIKLEDDCPQGNDDTRIFLLTNLGDKNTRQVTCLLCKLAMFVYDRYPLVDGTFFLSPINHDSLGSQVRFEGRDSFLLAICVDCLEHRSPRLTCTRCGARGWFPGSQLTLGGLYSYDVLSTIPCCPPECRHCRNPMLLNDPSRPGVHQGQFSVFSESTMCPSCGAKGPHYVRGTDSYCLTVEVSERQPDLRTVVGADLI